MHLGKCLEKNDWAAIRKDLIDSGAPVLNTHINIGTGKDLRISELANLVKEIVDFKGNL